MTDMRGERLQIMLSPEEFAVLVKSERPRWAEVIRKAGAKID